MARPTFLLLAVLLAAMTSGCWDRQEIENSAIIVAVGIDKAEPPDRFKVTVQMAIPPHTDGAGSAAQEPLPTNWIITATGSTIFDAIRSLPHQVPREVRLFNVRMLVFGEEFARDEGIKDALDFLDSDNDPRRRMWMLVAKDATASDVMRSFVPSVILTVDALDGMLNIAPRRTGTVVAHTMYEVMQMLSAPGWEAYVSPIEVRAEEGSPAEQNQLPQGVIPTLHPRLGGAALFRGTHLVGWLDEQTTRGLQFARGKVQGGALVVACDEKGETDMSISLLSTTGSLKPEFKDGKLSAKVEVRATGNLIELHCESRANIDVLNERFAKGIEKEVRAAIDALQKEFGVDALGLGLAVYQRLPKVWQQVEENWEAVFPTVPVEIEVKARLLRQGLTSSAAEVR